MPEQVARVRDPRAIKQVKITDFSAGIQAAPWQTALSTNNFILTTNPDQPAAIMGKTFGCYALPAGGIASMPGRSTSDHLNISASTTGTPTAGTTVWVQGIIPVTNGSISRIFYSIQLVTGGPPSADWRNELWRVDIQNSPANLTNGQTATSQGSTPLYPTSPFFTYLTPSSVPVQYFCSPVIIIGNICGIRAYNSNVSDDTNISNNGNGWFFPHQGRVVNVSTIANTIADTDNVIAVSFTDPPETDTLGTQNELFFPASCDDISCWGTLSSGELLLLSKSSGGVVLSGDIFSPYATAIPGLQGTGNLMGQGCLTPIGLVYLSGNSGAYVWSGGTTSQKISNQLPGNFYNTSAKYPSTFNNFAIGFWDNWVLFPDNWVYDISTSSWWQLTLPLTNPSYFFYAPFSEWAAGVGNGFFACPAYFTKNDGTSIDYFSPSSLTTSWTWASQAILIAEGEMVEVEELEVVLSGSSTVNISVETLLGGSVPLDTITVSSIGKPTVFRIPCRAQSDSIMITVAVTNASTSYPTILHSMSIGYRVGWRLKAS